MAPNARSSRPLWPDDGPAGPSEAAPRWVVYVDLDAYYVACELRDRPDLVGLPVIVGPPPAAGPSRGVVLSASYEARAFGVHSALPVRTAAALCPSAVWIPPDFPKYERVSREVRALLARHAPEVVPFSIDEAALVVDAPSAEAAREVAARVQRELRESLGLPASFGVATTRLVAKIATDKAKPGGIVVVPPDDVARFVAPLPVRAVPGVGPKTEERLVALGYRTVGDFAGKRPADVVRSLGELGRELIRLADGTPEEGPTVASGPRSRSTDRTFTADVASWPELEATIRALAADLATSLEQEEIRYGSVGVAFRWADFARSQRVRALAAAQEGAAALAERAVHLGRELWDAERAGRARSVRTVSVRVERLRDRRQRQVLLDDFSSGGRPGLNTRSGSDERSRDR